MGRRDAVRFSLIFAATIALGLAGGTLDAAVIRVNTTADVVSPVDGQCSLREAITASNTNVASGGVANECSAGSPAPARDRIRFRTGGIYQPSAANGQLPPLTDGYLILDGWSAPGAGPGRRPRVMIDGSLVLPPFEIGVYLLSDHNVVRGLAIGNFADFGVFAETAAAYKNWILGNYIGTDRLGTSAAPNGVGVVMQSGAFDNVVGTDGNGRKDGKEGNLISGNVGDGISVGDYGHRISGNRIGTDAAGTAALPNGAHGIVTQSTSIGLVIGTDGDGSSGDALEGNLISGNGLNGIVFGGLGDHVVAGNWIGVDATGGVALPNNFGVQVILGTDRVRIGTDGNGVSDDFERNVISGNTAGLDMSGSDHIVAGNYIGTDATGSFAVPNSTGVSLPLDGSGTNGGSIVGGASNVERNLISGNTNTGVAIGALDTVVECNYVGTDAAGTAAVGNVIGVNVFATATSASVRSNTVSFNEIGVSTSSPTGIVDDNIVSGNVNGLYWLDSGTLDAEDNWWGDASGPTNAGNPGGVGDTVLDLGGGTTDYDPWLLAEPVLCGGP